MSLSRRAFLVDAALAAGGLGLAFTLPACHGFDAATAARADATGELAPNAWLVVTPDDRVVFHLDRVEMGQGTMTSQTTLLAEELEIDPARIHVELAPASKEYANRELGFQITGGSTSTKTAWKPLREAGAQAREMLRAAAAALWVVPLAECAADDGTIVHRPTGRRQTYGQLSRAAAHQPIPAAPPLKAPRDFKWIGKSVPRLDARQKVTGTGVYGIDVKLPGLLTAVVIRSPVLGGTVRRHDASAARGLAGLVDVFVVPTGVAVVAEKYWQARAAAAKVSVTWDPGPLAATSSASLWEELERASRKPGKVVRHDGDCDAALARSDKRLEAVYRVPYLAHATMEPMNATAWVREDRCEIWAPTQSPGLALEEARRVTGLPASAITVHTTLLGGGFGRRLDQDYVTEALHVSRQLRRPVKVIWSREDDLANDHYRPMTFNILRGALDASGDVSAWFHHMVSQSILAQVAPRWLSALAPGALPQALVDLLARSVGQLYERNTLADPSSSEGASDFAYAIPALRVESTAVASEIPVGFWRGVGHSENAFIAESFLDELFHAGKKDPYLARRALLRGAPRSLRVLDLAAQQAGWGTPAPPGIFRGIAQASCFGSVCAQVAEVSVTGRSVRVHRVVAALDCGTVVNPDLVRAQIESAVVFGLSAALRQEITLDHGRVMQTNFHQFPALRMHEMPRVEVHLVPSDAHPSGVGETGLPPLAPAVANAVFAATGRRIRELPLEKALAREAG